MSLIQFKKRQRLIFVITVIVFLFYSGWIMEPYLHSIFVRNAAVTAWARVATAPIEGQITSELPSLASVIDEDGQIATIRNDRLFEQDATVALLENRVHRTEAHVNELRAFVDSLKGLKNQRSIIIEHYADAFRSELDTRIENLGIELSITRERIEIAERQLIRQQTLLQKNVSAEAALDRTKLNVAELSLEKSKTETELAYAQFRRSASDNNIFMEEDGADPPWARATDYEFEIQLLQAQHELNNVIVELKETSKAYAISKDDLKLLKEAVVSVPSGAVIQSIEVREGATVVAGETLVRWADCSDLLVDVPVLDAELALIKPGMTAFVVIEGERQERKALVLMTRGSTATLDRNDLVAVGKGRRAGIAQVIVQLSSSTLPKGECLIGRAANVHFEDVGLIDIIRVRMRL